MTDLISHYMTSHCCTSYHNIQTYTHVHTHTDTDTCLALWCASPGNTAVSRFWTQLQRLAAAFGAVLWVLWLSALGELGEFGKTNLLQPPTLCRPKMLTPVTRVRSFAQWFLLFVKHSPFGCTTTLHSQQEIMCSKNRGKRTIVEKQAARGPF